MKPRETSEKMRTKCLRNSALLNHVKADFAYEAMIRPLRTDSLIAYKFVICCINAMRWIGEPQLKE
jgi:hypothetical protein